MKYFDVEKILYQMVINFLNEKLSIDEKTKILNDKINMSDVMDLEDDFLSDVYFALKHFDEELCNTSNSEMIYLKECFEKKRRYSRIERDAYIQENEI